MHTSKKKISAIIACYNDALAIPLMAERLVTTFAKIGVDYEIIFVNDGSPDASQSVLESLASSNSRIKVITHSRNFGSQNAFSSGLKRATGDACVLLDGDLQDPPEIIESFYEQWLGGYDVVYGVRVTRQMPGSREVFYRIFYRLLKRLSYISIPLDAGDFSLIDRKVVDVLNHLPERDRFIRGLRAWVGFKQVGVPYDRPERMFGASTNNFLSNLRWAKKGIFSFTYLPLEMISVSAILISLLSGVALVAQVIGRILQPDLPHGFTTIIVVLLFLGSIQLICLALIAEYLGKIFEEVKQRPAYVVSKEINLAS
ncbi:MAG: glycosyltransferase family 2 protein [Candidatus Pacebacteria bacterium]|nr:glycosyltransferase family 2 protein [Candidatus Paceibacterota bacterium]